MNKILKMAAMAASMAFVGVAPALAEGDAAAAKSGVGPVLNGIVGRKAGEYPGYNYSDANKGSGITWDEATLKEYLTDPKAKVPGTKMIFPGIKRENQLDNLIAYLKLIKADGTGIE